MRRNVSLLFKTERKPKQAAGFDHLKEDLNMDKILDCVSLMREARKKQRC